MGIFSSLSWRRRGLSILGRIFIIPFIASLLAPASPAHADGSLTITPLTWNVIGLDSNTPGSGPYRFPIGARVCNTSSSTTTATVRFVWDDGNGTFWDSPLPDPYINLRTGSLDSMSLSLAAGGCQDAYFEAEVARAAAAYDKTRRYHITATDTSGTASTPRPRELYVEHLISQNRNGVIDLKLNGVPVAAGGTMTLMVGNTYTIELDAFTATQGYNQLESFVNFPNTIFQILSVNTTYSSDNSPYVPSPSSKLYADACKWDNNPGSPTYRSCIGGDYKAGGTVVPTYTVKIIGGAGTTEVLNTLLYDFSGSSYHYNSDFSTSARQVSIVGASAATIEKTFTPKAIAPGGNSVMAFKVANPTSLDLAGVNFADALPAGLQVAATPNVTYSGCGAGQFSPLLAGGETSVSFANGTIAANGFCTIKVSVTAASAGTYPNTTGHLFINSSLDTGNTGSATLTAANAGSSCIGGQTLATWNFDVADGTGVPPAYSSSNVSVAQAGYTGGTQTVDTSRGSPSAYSWAGNGFVKNTVYTATTAPYFSLTLDTSRYSDVSITLRSYASANWGTNNILRVWSSANGGSTWASTTPGTGTLVKSTWSGDQTFSAATTGAATTIFRINADGSTNNNGDMNLDSIVVKGCLIPAPAPTIEKSFSPDPIVKGSSSTLTFTLHNTAAANQALTGVAFSDVLPLGLSVVDSSSAACGGTLTTTAATRTIALTGGALGTGASCTFTVDVKGDTAGQYDNVTGFVSSTQSGTSTNYATDSLTVIAPPLIAKSFSPASIFTNNFSTLTFTITNPNAANSLSAVGFTDALPAGLTVVDGSGPACGATWTTAAPSTIALSGGTLAANGSCSFSVQVKGITAGTWNNTTSAVTSTEGGNGNTASASILVVNQTARIDLAKQVSTSAVGPWTSFVAVKTGDPVYYRFSVYNSGDVSFSSIAVSDLTLAGTSADPAGCNWAAFLPLAPGDTATCVRGPITALSGSHANTATATGTYASGTKDSVPSTATYATPALTIAKTVTETQFTLAGDLLHYSYLVTNTGFAPLLGPVSVTDDKATVTCPAVTTVGNGSDYLDPGESLTCSATYTVTAADVAAGFVTNSAFATADSLKSNTVTRTVTMPLDLTASKTNNAAGNTMPLGGSFDWTITVSNAGPGPAIFGGGATLLSDALPATGADYAAGTPSLLGGTSGPVLCAILSNTLTCSADGGEVRIPAGGSFSVAVIVTPTAAGSLTNPATTGACEVDPVGAIAETNEGNNTCGPNTVTVLVPPTIAKSFTPNTIASGGTSTISFVLSNPNDSALTNASFTDTLTDMTIDGNQSATGTCDGVSSNNFTDGQTSLSFSGLTIPANGSCTVMVDVTSSVPGVQPNTAGGVSTAEVPGPGTGSNTAELTVVGPPSIVKSFSPDTISVGNASTLSFTITNPNASTALSGVAFSDTLPAGVDVADSSSSVCGGTLTTTATTRVIALTGATISGGGTCEFNVTVTGATAGTKNNVTGNVTSTNGGTGDTGSATLTVNAVLAPSIAKSFSPAAVLAGGDSTLTFTITNPNASIDLTGVAFSDTLPAGVSVADSSTTVCGGTLTTTAATSLISLNGATIAAGATCQFDVTVLGSAAGVKNNVTGNVSSTNGGTGNTASATLTVNTVLPPSIAKSFSPAAVLAGGDSTLTFTITNPNAGIDLTGVAFSDTLPAGVSVADSSTTVCGGTLITTAASSLISLSGGAIAANAQCQFSVTVTGSSEGIKNNVTGNVTSTNGGTGNTASSTLTVNAPPSPAIKVTKTLIGSVFSSPTVVRLSYSILVENTGNVDLSAVQVTDDLVAAYPSPAAYAVSSVHIDPALCPTLTVNTAYDGNGTGTPPGDPNLLAHAPNTNTLPVGASCTIRLVVRVDTGGVAKTYTNTAVATGTPPTGNPVTSTSSAGGPSFIDPALTKAADPTQAAIGDTVTFTITVTNNGNVKATGVVVTDVLPDNLDYVSATSVDSKTKLPRGTVTLVPPRTVKVTIGDLDTPDKIIITVVTRVNGLGQPPVQNTASLVADPPPAGVSSDPIQNNTSTVELTIGNQAPGASGHGPAAARRLPSTGFAPRMTTILPPQPARKAYQAQSDVWLEIPRLHISMPIVAVPFANDTWDVTWLWDQAGWLQGTAYPSWSGNSVMTGHVYLSNGLPGPFLNLHTLVWGDQIIVHMSGERYIYQVRSQQTLAPDDVSVLQHEAYPWVTLLTCKGYNANDNTYSSRVAVRAVLIKAEEDTTSRNTVR